MTGRMRMFARGWWKRPVLGFIIFFLYWNSILAWTDIREEPSVSIFLSGVCPDGRKAEEILEKYLSQLEQWENYRSCLPGLERVKQAVTRRVLSTDLEGPEARELVELAVSRAVDLLSGGLKESLTPEDLERCAAKIEVHTAAKPRWAMPPEKPFRFPIFIDLCGKKAVVIGGGAVACRRAGVLARFDPAETPMSGAFYFVCLKENLFAADWIHWME